MMELFDEENAYTALAEQWENYGTLNGSPPKKLPKSIPLQKVVYSEWSASLSESSSSAMKQYPFGNIYIGNEQYQDHTRCI